MSNTISLLIGSPPSSPFASTALAFARSALQEQLAIYRIFFHCQGVLNCSLDHENQFSIISAWRTFAQEKKIDIVCCANSVNDHNLNQGRLFKGASIAGLTLLVEAQCRSNKVISF